MKIANISDYFIPKHTSGTVQSDEKIFVTVVLISVLFNLFAIKTAIEVLLTPIAYLLFFNAVFSLLLLYLYRRGLGKTTVGHLFLLQFEITFVAQAWLQGGVVSPAAAAFFLLPAVAMLTLGKREAVFWIILSTLSLIAIFIIENLYGSPVVHFPESIQKKLFFYSILTTNICIFSILLVYENGKSKSINELDKRHREVVLAQKQLVQSEKMASLGELTSGIAHEIQNPLNFVNNFSEVTKDLFREMLAELEAGNKAVAMEIAEDIVQNLDKINHHGKRADGIVKGMLQHSRTSSGKKELMDVNALCEEYLRLAYHGHRAKDKTFSATLKTEFDPLAGSIVAAPQEVGRVLLNIATNAFQACSERKNLLQDTDEVYEPTVYVKTKKEQNTVVISVSDNGLGIPPQFVDKIFQPFFTTKPSGKGTGLGLSISYDIITKGHEGDLKVETGDHIPGTTFTVLLPAYTVKQ